MKPLKKLYPTAKPLSCSTTISLNNRLNAKKVPDGLYYNTIRYIGGKVI